MDKNAWQFNENIFERNFHMLEQEIETDVTFRVSSNGGNYIVVNKKGFNIYKLTYRKYGCSNHDLSLGWDCFP